jgi:hypothetical protein
VEDVSDLIDFLHSLTDPYFLDEPKI